MTLTDTLHGRLVYNRRVRRLAELLSDLVPDGARVLDVGCGDGLLDALILQRRPDASITGIDVLPRPQTHIPVELFDGRRIPHDGRSFDVVMMVDVLHHTDDPSVLLGEAARVAKRAVILKDHTRDGLLAGPTLRFMDDVGNARHGVALPHNYWPRSRWHAAFGELGLTVEAWNADLSLYPWPASWIFGRSLHFVARLSV